MAKSRTQYPVKVEPINFTVTVTVFEDSWHQAWSDPLRKSYSNVLADSYGNFVVVVSAAVTPTLPVGIINMPDETSYHAIEMVGY